MEKRAEARADFLLERLKVSKALREIQKQLEVSEDVQRYYEEGKEIVRIKSE